MRCSRDMTNGWLPLSLTRLDGQLKEKHWGHKPLSVEIPLLSWTLTLRGTKLQSYFCFFCHRNLTFGQQFLLCGPPRFLKNQFDVSQTPINVSKPLCRKTLRALWSSTIWKEGRKEYIFKEMFCRASLPCREDGFYLWGDWAAEALQTHVPFHAPAPTFNFNWRKSFHYHAETES